MPLLGRTQYFFGEVVLTLKATLSWPGLCRLRVTGIFLRSSKRNFSSEGWMVRSDAAMSAVVFAALCGKFVC